MEIQSSSTSNQVFYGLVASIKEYTLYGQYVSCEVLLADNTTSQNFCEEIQTTDAYASTDEDEIDGSAQVFNDIRVSAINIAQGYNSDGTGFASNTVDENYDGELNVGATYVQAQVEHRGSDPMEVYDWNVSITVTAPDSTVTQIDNITSCDSEDSIYTVYAPLGSGVSGDDPPLQGEIFGFACAMVDLDLEGDYTFLSHNSSNQDD